MSLVRNDRGHGVVACSSATTRSASRQSASSWLIVEQAGAVIGDAQRADPASVGEGKRHPGVEPNPDRPGHGRVVREPRVLERVRDLEDIGGEDRVCADRLVSVALRDIEAGRGLEPLPLRVDQRHQRDRRRRDLAGLLDEAIEARLARACRARPGGAGPRVDALRRARRVPPANGMPSAARRRGASYGCGRSTRAARSSR